MYTTTAKFTSKCAETGKIIRKGDTILYDKANKKAYCKDSSIYNKPADQGLANYVQANEDAYFDNFCQNNGI